MSHPRCQFPLLTLYAAFPRQSKLFASFILHCLGPPPICFGSFSSYSPLEFLLKHTLFSPSLFCFEIALELISSWSSLTHKNLVPLSRGFGSSPGPPFSIYEFVPFLSLCATRPGNPFGIPPKSKPFPPSVFSGRWLLSHGHFLPERAPHFGGSFTHPGSVFASFPTLSLSLGPESPTLPPCDPS